jgi:ATP-dependent exoDNAse (exonuclease V) alpha subunit
MLRAKELMQMNEHLKQAKSNDKAFGGSAVLLVGDPGQLPAVGGTCVWENIHEMKHQDDKIGAMLYTQFSSVIALAENRRVMEGDKSSKLFCELLDRIRDAEVTEDDWKLLKQRSKDSIGAQEWARQGFEDDDVHFLFVYNRCVDKYNLNKLQSLNKSICRIKAKHTGNWRSVSSDSFRGLEPSLYLCEEAKVMFTNNTLSKANITNGTIGTVKVITFKDKDLNQDGTLKKPCLPDYVWVDFGDNYTGASFFPNDPTRSGWVPIFPCQAKFWRGNSEATRTMLPLKLAWAWTIHKAQGQTFKGKFVIDLGDNELAPGLTYVALSRATKLENIGFMGGLSLDRVTTKLKSKGIEQRKAHEAFLQQVEATTIAKINSLGL